MQDMWKEMLKNCIPCQAVCNMLEISELPKEFRLERILIES